MDGLQAYRRWWQPLPAWLKLVTAVSIYPAWLFIIYCGITGASKRREAVIAFGIFAIGTLLHIAFDRRTDSGDREGNGFDFLGGE